MCFIPSFHDFQPLLLTQSPGVSEYPMRLVKKSALHTLQADKPLPDPKSPAVLRIWEYCISAERVHLLFTATEKRSRQFSNILEKRGLKYVIDGCCEVAKLGLSNGDLG